MRVKRYVVKSMAEATAQIRQELGPDAVLLHTQKKRVGGLFGLFGTEVYEVLAAAPEPPAVEPTTVALAQEVQAMQKLLGEVVERLEEPELARWPEEYRDIYARLQARGVAAPLALALCQRAQGAEQPALGPLPAEAQVRRQLTRELGEAAPITVQPASGRRVVLIGPTGVGKTTSLAKLAAFYALGQGLKVGLLACDTYRIAAVQQLKTYAQIIGLPVEVAATPAEVAPALARLGNGLDLILVDTAGRSHRHEEHMEELKGLLAALVPDEIHLVLSLTSGASDLLALGRAYEPYGYQKILLTKADEAEAPGGLYALRQEFEKPFSYLTTGQSVPDEIEVAAPGRLANLVIGGA